MLIMVGGSANNPFDSALKSTCSIKNGFEEKSIIFKKSLIVSKTFLQNTLF